jgi:hypothetical protein
MELCSSCFGLPLNFIASIWFGWPFGQGLCAATAFVMSVSGKQYLFKNNLYVLD